jgi:hypothetical protein
MLTRETFDRLHVCLQRVQSSGIPNTPAGCSKRPSSKAAASEETRRTLQYVELLSDTRPPLGERRVSARRGWVGEKSDFLSILLGFFLAC